MKIRINSLLGSLIIVIIILVFSFPAMATNVGGIIDTDTTWDLLGSPYNITSDVQIEEGVTLTIESGVIVNGNDKWIEVWGALEAVGLQGDYIKFDYVNVLTRTSNASLNIEFANLLNTFLAATHAAIILRNSIIQNRWISVNNTSGDCYIERNIFIKLEELSLMGNSSNVYIRNNVFFESGYIWVDNNQVVIEYNSFLSTDKVALRADDTNISAINNYWNTTDTAVIDLMIYDRNDDLNIGGYIEYIPFLTEPHPNTPIPDFNQAPTSNSGSDQVVHDEVTLNGIGSSDPDGSIVSYDWSLQHRTNSANDRTASGDTPTIYNLNPGFYDVYLTVTDDGGLVGVDNMLLAAAGSCFCTASTMHIESIHVGTYKGKYGKATVTVFDDCGNPVPAAAVSGTFSGDFNGPGSGVTDANGVAVILYTDEAVKKPSYTFCVDNVADTLPYEPDDNVVETYECE